MKWFTVKSGGLIAVLFIFVFIQSSFAQADSSGLSVNNSLFEPELNFQAGKLIKIHGEYPENGLSWMNELNLSFKTRGKKYWQQLRKYPSIGLSITWSGYGNKEVLGYGFGLVPTLRGEWPKKKWILAARGGIGISYFNKPYDSIDNPQNIAIGTSVTAMAIGWAGALVPVSKNLRLNFGVSATHCSDGHMGVPNVGLNVLAFSTGIAYTPQSSSRVDHTGNMPATDSGQNSYWNSQFSTHLGLHEFQGTVRPVDGPLYPVYGLGITLVRRHSEGGSFLIGFDTYYYTAFHDYIIMEELFQADEAVAKSFNAVLFGGYEWYFGNLSLFFQVGINVYAPFYHEFAKVWDLPHKGPLNEWTAQKLGYKYYFMNQKLFVSTAIKTNGGTADFFETSIGLNLGGRR